MNQVFRIVWSHSRNAWVVVSDLAKRCTKSGSGRRSITSATSLASITLLGLAAVPALTADLYWDPNGNLAGRGGTGNWDTSSLFWATNPDGTTPPFSAWSNAALDRAIFGGVGGTATLTQNITVGALTFQISGVTLTGGTITLQGVAPTIDTGAGISNYLNSTLAGSSGVTFTGPGMSPAGWLALSGANTLTGGITIDTGARIIATGGNNVLNGANNVVTVNDGAILEIQNSNAFGGNTDVSRLVMNDGATLWLGNASLTHDITAHGGTITIADPYTNGIAATWLGTLTLTADTTLSVTGTDPGTTFAGNLSDTGANQLSFLSNSPGQSVVLSGNNTFTGGITVNGGGVALWGTGAAGAANNVVTINSGGLIDANGDAFRDADAADVIVNSGGTFRVRAGHTLTHDITLTGGTATVDGNGTWDGTAVLTADTTLNLGGSGQTTTIAADLSDTGGVLSLQTFGTTTFTGNLNFSGDWTIAGGNTWLNAGTHTYTGDTIITGGALMLNSATTLSQNTNIRFDADSAVPSGGGVIFLTNSVPSFTRAVGTNPNEISWTGSGGFYALNNNTDATVNLFNDGRTLTWGAGSFVPDGETLILGTNTGNSQARQLTFQNGIDLNGAVRTVRADNGNINDHVVLSGTLTGTGGLQIAGNGLLELTGNNNYSGPTIVGDAATNGYGNLFLGGAGSLSANSNLQINGFTNTDGIADGGIVLLTAASGDFTMPLGLGAGQVQWTNSGGFAAIGATRTVNLGGAGATLTWGSGGFVPDGDVLRLGSPYGNATINWANGIALGATNRTVYIREQGIDRDVHMSGVIQGAGGLTLIGTGDVELYAANTFAGTLTVGDTTGNTDGLIVYADTLANTGAASSLGSGATVRMASHTGRLIYTGSADASTNRDLELAGRHGSGIWLENRGTGRVTWTGDISVNNGNVEQHLLLGGTAPTTPGYNEISGVLSNGTGILRVGTDASNPAVWRLSGANTYTGDTSVRGATLLEVTDLQNGGAASSIGASSNAASNLVVAGTLRYVGDGDSTDRLFTVYNNGGGIESSGTGALAFTNTGELVRGAGNTGYHLRLGGTNTDENTFAPTLTNLVPLAMNANNLNLYKDDAGLWALVTDNNANANAYSGNTTLRGGALRLDNAGAITGGLGAISSHGATGSTQRSSLVSFEGLANGTAGVLGLTAASGGFYRDTTTASWSFVGHNNTADLNDDTFIHGVRWIGSGGFAAWDGVQTVNLFGDGRALTWGANGFVLNGHHLVFGYQDADGTVDFQNAINLGNTTRTFDVRRGVVDADAILSGAITGTGTAGIVKNGSGVLAVAANNSFSGNTNVNAGVLQLGNGGTTGNLGNSAQVILASGTALAMNRTDAALTLNTVTDGAGGGGTLHQMGTGTTTITANSDVDHILIDVGRLASSATMLTDDVIFSDAGGGALAIGGTFRTDTSTAVTVTGGILGDSVIVSAGGNALVTASLGDGNDVLDVGGTLDTAGGTFVLGAGDDTFTVRDDAVITGAVDGGVGNDTLNTAIATVATLGPAGAFETLTKTGVGVLNATGPAAFNAVNVQQGTMSVNTGATITAMSTTVGANATLRVNDTYNGTASNDTFTVAGTLTGAGSVALFAGDDQLILQDGVNLSGLTNPLDGGTQTSVDAIVLDSASALTVDLSHTTDFENLRKQNAGTATVTGTQSFNATSVNDGTLVIAGQLDTPTIAIAGGATFQASGLVQAAGGTAVALTGDAGANTVRVASGGTLLGAGDLGDGNDTVSVAGTLDTLGADVVFGVGADLLDVAGTLELGGGTALLGDGNDTFTIHDGTVVNGTVDGGAGLDSRAYNINLSADFSQLVNFEGLTKTGTGVLNVNGPGSSSLAEVEVQGGTLNVAAGASIDGATRSVVASGATLRVDGAFTGTAGDDTFTLSGTVAGANDVQLGTGDDVLTLREGALLGTQVDGGAETAGDTVALDIATAYTFDGANAVSFELLAKQNVGTATLTNTQTYAGASIEGGTLDVDGTLETPTLDLADDTTLNVDGVVQATGATAVAIAGDTGANTVRVGSTGTLIASGGLGDGADTLDVNGTLELGGGTFDLGAGDDTFIVYDGTNVTGTVSGGAGLDGRVYDLVGTANVGALQQFEGLTKRNTGTLNINGPAVTSDLLEVSVEGGVLNVASTAEISGVQSTEVASGATLNVDGSYLFTAGVDSLDVAGTVSGLGTVDLLDGDDALTLFDGADLTGLATAIEGGAGMDTLTADINTTGKLGGAVGFETLVKEGTGSLSIEGPVGSVFETVLVQQGVLRIASGVTVDPQTTAVDAGATIQVDGNYHGTTGADTFTLSGSLAGAGEVDLLDGDDVLTINTGADTTFTGSFEAGSASADSFVLAGSDSDTFDVGLIDTVFQNFDQFRKEGTGTWRLTGATDRDWTVVDGTLIGDTTSFGGDIDNSATVVFDQATDGTFDRMLSGSGSLIKQGAGTLTMAGDQPFSGNTQIAAGTLQVDGVLPSAITIANGGTLSGTGRVSSVATLAGGVVAPGNSTDQFGTLTIAGSYSGAGTVRLNTELNDESSRTSRLVIQGDASGTSTVLIAPAGGEGAKTSGDGIEIIQVDGSSAADNFRLAQPVQAGAYEYLLNQGGEADTNDWYLRSHYIGPGPEPEVPAFRPGVAGYVLGHQTSLEYGFSALGNLRSRVGSQGRVLDLGSDGSSNVWMRASAQEVDMGGTRFSAQDVQTSVLQFGTDVYGSESAQGGAHFGVMASIGDGNASFYDSMRALGGLNTHAGEIEMDVGGAGLYWTMYGNEGGYLDLSAQFLRYSNEYEDLFLADSTQRGWGGTLSAEIGAAYGLGSSNWKVEPQLQVGYQQLDLDDFSDNVSSVAGIEEEALRARAGLQLFRAAGDWLGMRNASPYIAIGIQKDFIDPDAVSIGGTVVSDELPDTTMDASVGFTGSIVAGFELHLDARYQQATEGEKDGVRANFGIRKRF